MYENVDRKKIFLGLMISIACLLLIIYIVDFQEVFQVLSQFNMRLLFLLFVLYCFSMVIRAYRWKIIMGQCYHVKLFDIIKALLLGYMFNSLLPVKIGELTRVYYLGKKNKISKSFLLGSVIVERFLDFSTIALFLLFSVVFSETVRRIVDYNATKLFLLLIVLAALAIIFFKSNLFLYLFRLLPENLSIRFRKMHDLFIQSFKVVKNRKSLLLLVAHSLIIWLIAAFSTFIIIRALVITVPYYAYFFIVSASVFGMAIPSTSGGVGVYHTVSAGALMIFGVSIEIAITYALLAHAVEFILNVVFGLIVFITDN